MLEIIITTILTSIILNIFLRRFNMPTIIGYIITGILISIIFGLHDIHNNYELKSIAEFGIVFLMFTIGLEFSIQELGKMKKNVLLLGGLQFFITTFIFFVVIRFLLGFDEITAIIIASGLSLSSTAIVLKTLTENLNIDENYGKKSVGILLFQDLAVIPIFLMISVFSNNDTALTLIIGQTILGSIVLLVFLWFVGEYLLDPFLHKVSKANSDEVFIGAILFIIIGSSYAAHKLGLSYSLGALLAGVMIAETHYKHQVQSDLIPFRDLLLGVFFVTVGMQLEINIIQENIILIACLLVSLICIKSIIIYSIIRITGSTKSSSLKTALTLFQIGEFAIIIFELGMSESLIPSTIGQLLIVVIILSMIMTPFILKHINCIYKTILGEKCTGKTEKVKKYFTGHTVIIGYSRLGVELSDMLENRDELYVIIERKIKYFKEAERLGRPIIFGDATKRAILKSVNIKYAKKVIVTVGNSQRLYMICETICSMAENADIIVKVNSFSEKTMLSDLNISKIIVETESTAISMIN